MNNAYFNIINVENNYEPLLIEVSNTNKELLRQFRLFLLKLLLKSNIDAVADCLDHISSHVFTWFKLLLFCNHLLEHTNDVLWDSFLSGVLHHNNIKYFENDFPMIVIQQYPIISQFSELKPKQLYLILCKCIHGKFANLMNGYLKQFFSSESTSLLQKKFVLDGHLLKLVKLSIHVCNKKLSDPSTIQQIMELAKIFLKSKSNLMISSKNNFERKRIGEILYFIILKINSDSSNENLPLLIKESFNECLFKDIYKEQLNIFMQEDFTNFKENKGFFDKIQNTINSIDCIENILKIECDENLKPLVNFHLSFFNHFISGEFSKFPTYSLIKNIFVLVEKHKEDILNNKELPKSVYEELELEGI